MAFSIILFSLLDELTVGFQTISELSNINSLEMGQKKNEKYLPFEIRLKMLIHELEHINGKKGIEIL